MTNSIILTDLARKCSAITKEKGFFDVWAGDEIGLLKHNVLQVKGEISEAYEGLRKGIKYEGKFIKDSYEDELADSCIFALSILGCMNHDIFYHDEDVHDSFEDFVLFDYEFIPCKLNSRSKKDAYLANINTRLNLVLNFCKKNNIDIFKHIEEKMQYNAGREKLHGKKF